MLSETATVPENDTNSDFCSEKLEDCKVLRITKRESLPPIWITIDKEYIERIKEYKRIREINEWIERKSKLLWLTSGCKGLLARRRSQPLTLNEGNKNEKTLLSLCRS